LNEKGRKKKEEAHPLSSKGEGNDPIVWDAAFPGIANKGERDKDHLDCGRRGGKENPTPIPCKAMKIWSKQTGKKERKRWCIGDEKKRKRNGKGRKKRAAMQKGNHPHQKIEGGPKERGKASWDRSVEKKLPPLGGHRGREKKR